MWRRIAAEVTAVAQSGDRGHPWQVWGLGLGMRTFGDVEMVEDDARVAGPAVVVLRVLVGSRAYGLAREESDSDVRGVYVAGAARQWSMKKPAEQFEDDAEQTVIWEIEKFLGLAMKGNPAILEAMWSPAVLFASEIGKGLIGLREKVLSRAVHRSFLGYAETQFVGMSRARDRGGNVKWRHAMHMIRLLIAGEELVRTGRLRLDATEHREKLLRIRDGAESWSRVLGWKDELTAKMEDAVKTTSLPEAPDWPAADAFLIGVRGDMARRGVACG